MPSSSLQAIGLATALMILATCLPAAESAPAPAFLAKVQLHNFAGVEPVEDGTGVRLYRLPKEVRDKLDPTGPDGKESTGATQMRYARHSEIRFVLNQGVKPSDVQLHLQTQGSKPVQLSVYWGDVLAGAGNLNPGGKAKPLSPYSHGLLENVIALDMPKGRYANQVCRVVINGGEIIFNGIDGDVRAPRPEELAPVMLSYGTSISQGAMASRCDLAWNALTARALGYDFVNLGSSGTAFCEPAMADFKANSYTLKLMRRV